MDLWIQAFGTGASIIVAISLTMKNIKRLRVINCIGAASFSIYGGFIGSTPVLILNAFIAIIDLYYLYNMEKTKQDFKLLSVDTVLNDYARHFLEFHSADIKRYAPGFSYTENDERKAVFILRDTIPVSLVIYSRRPDGSIDIWLDYAAASHRDYKNAEFFFGEEARAIAGGQAAMLYATSGTKAHERYLRRFGFTPTGGLRDGETEFVKSA